MSRSKGQRDLTPRVRTNEISASSKDKTSLFRMNVWKAVRKQYRELTLEAIQYGNMLYNGEIPFPGKPISITDNLILPFPEASINDIFD